MDGDITITGPGFAVSAYRNGPIVPTDAYGGHEVTQRPKREGITDWVGRAPFKLQLPILLSAKGDSIEPSLRSLERAAIGEDNNRTDPVKLTGRALALPPGSGPEGWFIEDIDRTGKEDRRGFDMVIIRKELVFTLLEKNAGDQVKEPALTTGVNGKTVVTHYTVRHGDTLQSIAARELGDHTRWTDIAVLNGLRSSGQLKVGMELKLP